MGGRQRLEAADVFDAPRQGVLPGLVWILRGITRSRVAEENPATFEAEPFRSLIRRGVAGDVRGGDLRSGSTVCLRREGKSRREAARVFGLSREM